MNFGLKFSLQFENICYLIQGQLSHRVSWTCWWTTCWSCWSTKCWGTRRSLTKCKLDRVTLNTFPNVHKSQMMVIDNVKASVVIWKEVTHTITLVPASDKLKTVNWHRLQNVYLVDDSVCKTCQVVEAQIGWGSLSKLIKVIFPLASRNICS